MAACVALDLHRPIASGSLAVPFCAREVADIIRVPSACRATAWVCCVVNNERSARFRVTCATSKRPCVRVACNSPTPRVAVRTRERAILTSHACTYRDTLHCMRNLHWCTHIRFATARAEQPVRPTRASATAGVGVTSRALVTARFRRPSTAAGGAATFA